MHDFKTFLSFFSFSLSHPDSPYACLHFCALLPCVFCLHIKHSSCASVSLICVFVFRSAFSRIQRIHMYIHLPFEVLAPVFLVLSLGALSNEK
ncbi:hypothetical protein BDW42DRAFT_178418 [Aspergillus taichungensis]|uniref:Uncharacterized protein n=1 Tax=Aspergillus taichungensis TaxID=482145 RepID=A0A2J5HHY0_9EURO|nr:hypothetical protein BDW42DRAFT_178418 [Aspergillus taichungensis]